MPNRHLLFRFIYKSTKMSTKVVNIF